MLPDADRNVHHPFPSGLTTPPSTVSRARAPSHIGASRPRRTLFSSSRAPPPCEASSQNRRCRSAEKLPPVWGRARRDAVMLQQTPRILHNYLARLESFAPALSACLMRAMCWSFAMPLGSTRKPPPACAATGSPTVSPIPPTRGMLGRCPCRPHPRWCIEAAAEFPVDCRPVGDGEGELEATGEERMDMFRVFMRRVSRFAIIPR